MNFYKEMGATVIVFVLFIQKFKNYLTYKHVNINLTHLRKKKFQGLTYSSFFEILYFIFTLCQLCATIKIF